MFAGQDAAVRAAKSQTLYVLSNLEEARVDGDPRVEALEDWVGADAQTHP